MDAFEPFLLDGDRVMPGDNDEIVADGQQAIEALAAYDLQIGFDLL